MMSGIKSRNTKPEIHVRKALFRRGFRFRLHDKKLPGKPDIVLPKYHAVILIHGCFWHGHDCRYFKIPKTRTEFWMDKIRSNKNRDQRDVEKLIALGWRVGIIWECVLRTKNPPFFMNGGVDRLCFWIDSDISTFLESSI